MRVRLVILVAVATGLALAGCGGADDTDPDAASSSASPSSAATAPSAAEPSAVPSAPASPAAARVTTATCTGAQLTPELTLQPGPPAGQPQRALLALTNSSSTPCVLNGWASVTLSNAAGSTVPVPTSRVNEPGAPVSITLAPGRTAFAGITWVPCDKSDPTCGVGNSLSVAPPGATVGKAASLVDFPKPEDSDLTMKSLRIGSIQPSTQGVVAW